MKLELKHLSAYLPYDVKVYDIGTKKIFSTPLNLKTIEYLVENITKDSLLKLVLRPLSDLTKEIEVNGKKFVPADILNEYDNGGIAFECDTNGYGEWYMAFFYADGLDSFSFSNFEIIREKLLEWHFDVFGLIEQNLAININTL